MKIIHLSDNQKTFIKSNCNRMMNGELATALGLSKWRVGEWMRQNGVKPMKQLCRPKRIYPLEKEDCFKVHSEENWLV